MGASLGKRTVAALIFSFSRRVNVRLPTGSPLARYASTTDRNTSRDRSFISSRSFVASFICISLNVL